MRKTFCKVVLFVLLYGVVVCVEYYTIKQYLILRMVPNVGDLMLLDILILVSLVALCFVLFKMLIGYIKDYRKQLKRRR